MLGNKVVDGFLLAIECHTRAKHEKAFARSSRTVSKPVIIELIPLYLWIALCTGNTLYFIRQCRLVDILGYSTNGIYQGTIVNGIAWIHFAIAHNLQGLANRVFIAKEAFGQAFSNNTLVGGI